MKKFTLKDFILYNAPCFNCGNKITVNVCKMDANNDSQKINMIPSTIDGSILSFGLLNKYHYSLFIKIDISNNLYELYWYKWDASYEFDARQRFYEYMFDYILYFELECKRCKTIIRSQSLEFNDKFLEPLSLLFENLVIQSDKFYTISSEFTLDASCLTIWDSRGQKRIETIDIPLLPLYILKNKKNALKKLKTYLIML